MPERKLVSTKLQYVLSCIPFFGFFIAVFCGFYNFKSVKRKGYFYILGYWLLVGIPLLIVAGLVVYVTSALAGAQSEPNIVMLGVVYVLESFVFMLLGAFYAVWLQNRLLKKIEREENEMYLY